jgi:hypothetical protein
MISLPCCYLSLGETEAAGWNLSWR